jgi:hypothetical protein
MLQIFPFRVLKHEDLPFQTDPEAEALPFQNVEIETPGTDTDQSIGISGCESSQLLFLLGYSSWESASYVIVHI